MSSIIDSLSPWLSILSRIAMDDRSIMACLHRHGSQGKEATSCVPTLVSRIVRSYKVLNCLIQHQNLNSFTAVGSRPCFSVSCCPSTLLRRLCECIAALRCCLERKTVTLLHRDMGQALQAILHNRSPQVLVTIGQYLCKIRSDKAAFPSSSSAPVTQKEMARAEVTCCMCSAGPLFEFVRPQGKEPVCTQCYASLSRPYSVRSCDLLSLYALQLLRGETKPNEDDMRAVIKVFEFVYPSGEFAMSKTALMCVGSTLNAFAFSTRSAPSRRTGNILLPRWVAHALFPEYSVSITFDSGESSPGRFAATLGWCEYGGAANRTVTPLENALLEVMSGDVTSRSDIVSKTGDQPCAHLWQLLLRVHTSSFARRSTRFCR